MGDKAPRQLLAEAIGAFTLSFAGGGAVMLANGNTNVTLVGVALAHGLAIGLMVLALGGVSGGHFNPAVTIGFWVTRRIATVLAAGYVVAQLLGAVVAGLLLFLLFPEGLRTAAHLGTPTLGPATDFVHAVGIEAVLTFFLVTVIWGTAVDPRGPSGIAGLAIGLTISMDILAAGPLTGAVMNPSRGFGTALVSGYWNDQLVFWIGPVIGAVIAALLYHYVLIEEPMTSPAR